VAGPSAAVIHSSVMAKRVRQSSAPRRTGRQNSSDIAGFPLDSAARAAAAASGD